MREKEAFLVLEKIMILIIVLLASVCCYFPYRKLTKDEIWETGPEAGFILYQLVYFILFFVSLGFGNKFTGEQFLLGLIFGVLPTFLSMWWQARQGQVTISVIT